MLQLVPRPLAPGSGFYRKALPVVLTWGGCAASRSPKGFSRPHGQVDTGMALRYESALGSRSALRGKMANIDPQHSQIMLLVTSGGSDLEAD